MITHLAHLMEGLGAACAALGALVTWIPTVIYYRRKVRKIRNG